MNNKKNVKRFGKSGRHLGARHGPRGGTTGVVDEREFTRKKKF